jgi:hemerythrin-like domain-containing protein
MTLRRHGIRSGITRLARFRDDLLKRSTGFGIIRGPETVFGCCALAWLRGPGNLNPALFRASSRTMNGVSVSGARLEAGMAFDTKLLSRRGVFALAAGAGALSLAGGAALAVAPFPSDEHADENISPTEDLMREHGVLRRTLNVYSELAIRLQAKKPQLDAAALLDAARLFREFGEDYHETTLEEQHVFPELKKSGGANEKLVGVLLSQHQRGREITDYIVRVASRGKLAGDAKPLARALASMTRMYNAHAAWEDTAAFPAWKATLPKDKQGELAKKFEDIEHEKFGKDGFEQAVARIAKIEEAFGLGDLAAFTAPPPPKT